MNVDVQLPKIELILNSHKIDALLYHEMIDKLAYDLFSSFKCRSTTFNYYPKKGYQTVVKSEIALDLKCQKNSFCA